MMRAKRRISALVTPYKWQLLLVLLINAASVFFAILTMMLIEPFLKLIFKGTADNISPIGEWLMQFVYPFINAANPQNLLFYLVGFVVLLFLFKNLFFFLAQCVMAPIRADFVRQLRNRLYEKVLILPLAFFSEQKKGDVISRAVNDTQEIEFTVLKSLQQLLTDPLTVLFYLVTLFVMSWQLTLFVLILLPLAGLVIGRITKSLRRQSFEAKDKLGNLLAHVEETIVGLRIVKGFNAQQHAETVFAKQNAGFTALQQRILRRVDLASPMSEFLGVSAVMIILVFGGSIVLREGTSLTAELFITYIALFSQIINPAKNISTAVSNYKRGLAALDRIYEVLDADEVIQQKENAAPIRHFEHEIVFEEVHFAYQQNEVLKGVSCSVKKGQMVALVGQSGSGKSTMLDLLMRFYDVQSGRILVDGNDVTDLVIDDLRSLFSIVSQEVVLFHDTIFNNIAFGLPDVSEEAVVAAAKAAHAYDFIMALPDGFGTVVGDRGLNLSGGQRQRLSIARAVLRNAPILLLDEATSAMDSESEKLVQAAIDNVLQNRTAIVIAHRLSTIQHADNIFVMERGEIVERGTHAQLLEQNGRYAQLVKIQHHQ